MSENLEQENELEDMGMTETCLWEDDQKHRCWKIGSKWGTKGESVLDLFYREGILFAGNDDGKAERLRTQVREGDLFLVTHGVRIMAVARVTSPGAPLTRFEPRFQGDPRTKDYFGDESVVGVRAEIYPLNRDEDKYEYGGQMRFHGTSQCYRDLAIRLWRKYRERAEERRGNLFEWANKELAQDSFLCWLFTRRDVDPESVEGRAARRLIVKLAGDEAFVEGPLEVMKQWKHIDILLAFGEKDAPSRRFLIVEDKVSASLYNNLDAYHETVCSCFKVTPDKVRCAVLKTGEDGHLLRQIEDLKRKNVEILEANAKIPEKEASQRERLHVIPSLMFREELFEVLTEEYQDKMWPMGTDETFRDYVAHLDKWNAVAHRYKKEAYSEWSKDWTAYCGFLTALSKRPGAIFDHWFYVNNPSQPFNALCMGYLKEKYICNGHYYLYFHVNSAMQELQLRIGGAKKETCREPRSLVYNTILEMQKDTNAGGETRYPLLNVLRKPSHFGSGADITIMRLPAIVKGTQDGWLVLREGELVDVPETAKRLNAFAMLLDDIAPRVEAEYAKCHPDDAEA